MEQFLDPSATTSAPRAILLESALIAPSPVDRQEAALEAIVLSIGRPPLLVQNGTYVVPPGSTEEVKRIIDGFNHDTIDHVIARSARVELCDIPRMPYVGTGWIIEKPEENRAIIVTNRHVAEYFAVSDGAGGYRFRTAPNFRPYETRVDLKKLIPFDPFESYRRREGM